MLCCTTKHVILKIIADLKQEGVKLISRLKRFRVIFSSYQFHSTIFWKRANASYMYSNRSSKRLEPDRQFQKNNVFVIK